MPEEKKVKEGYKTTEFWVAIAALATMITGQFTDINIEGTTQAATGAVAAIYALARAITKR